MKRKIALLTGLLFVFIVPQVSAAQASTSLQTFSGEACPTGSAKYAVEVTNPGNAADTYTVDTNVPWSTVAPSTVEVGGGETESVFVWLQPPRDLQPGTYDFTVSVRSSNTGQETTETGQIEVLSCRAVDLTAQEASKNVCRGETATYGITVRNTGRSQETYRLAASAGALSQQQVTLGAGESTQVTLSASSDQAVQETLRVAAESTSSYAQDTIDLEFQAEECRSAQLFVSPSERSVCGGETAEFRITARNTGRIADTYSLSTNVEGANVPSLELEPGESRTFRVNVRENQGEHTIVARLTSQNQPNIRITENSVLQAENCYDIVVTAESQTVKLDRANKSLLQFGIGNNGTRETTVDLAFDGPEWADFRPQQMTLQPGQQRIAYLYLAPDFFSEEGTYTGKLSITGENGRINRVIDVNIVVGEDDVTTEPDGQDQNGTPQPSPGNGDGQPGNGNATDGDGGTPTGDLISRTAGLVALLVVLAALFVGGYWLFRKRRDEEPEDGAVATDETGAAGAAAADESEERERRREDVRERIRQRRRSDDQTADAQPADRDSIRDQVGGRDQERNQKRDEHGRFTRNQENGNGDTDNGNGSSNGNDEDRNGQ